MTQILAIDQGTTNSKAVLVDHAGSVRAIGSAPVTTSHPRPGWVEQDPELVWTSVVTAVERCLSRVDPATVDLAGIALSTQRESVVAWERHSGQAIGPVIGWQDVRTADWCRERTGPCDDDLVSSRTGLRIDAMFSAPKIGWLLRHCAADRDPADVCVGTIDSWLVWRLTGGRHLTEAGNASRTLLYDIVELSWSPALLDVFGIPAEVLAQVQPSDGDFGTCRSVPGLPDGLPITAVLADSHAALFGQGCREVGTAKATYGTGTSVMSPTDTFVPGTSPVPSTLAWLTDAPRYAREGNILSSGATLAWTARLLGLADVPQLLDLAGTVDSSADVTLIPAFTGLGAPHWDRTVRGVITRLEPDADPARVARAAVDAVAHQVCDIVEVIDADAGTPLTGLRADGGASASDLVMQTQADLLGRPVEVADLPEVSAVGVAELARRRLGGAPADRPTGRRFEPSTDSAARSARRDRWRAEIAWLRSGLRP